MERCTSSKKVKFQTELLALEALRHNKISMPYSTAASVYVCHDYGYWHLSSKGKPDTKLEIKNTSKEALHWEEKFRKLKPY